MSDLIKWCYDRSGIQKIISYRSALTTETTETDSILPGTEFGPIVDNPRIAVTDIYISHRNVADTLYFLKLYADNPWTSVHVLVFYVQKTTKDPIFIAYTAPVVGGIGDANGKLTHQVATGNSDQIDYLVGYFVLHG